MSFKTWGWREYFDGRTGKRNNPYRGWFNSPEVGRYKNVIWQKVAPVVALVY
jgi:hypothetical protein